MKPYKFPQASQFNKIVAKEKIFQKTGVSSAAKSLFKKEIEQIRCIHELTEDSVNLKSSEAIPKILVLQLFLKKELIDVKVLSAIDKAFGVPVVFQLHWQKKIKYAACYRRRNESDHSKWVFSEYFFSTWINTDGESDKLPIVLSLKKLYETILRQLLPIESKEPLNILIDRVEQIRKIEREAEKVAGRMKKEKQFNRKVEMNRELNELKDEIRSLKDG